MKKKIYCYSGVLLAGMLFLVGCGNEIPEMNEEERNMVVNYAADIVQKYDSNRLTKFQMMTPSPEESIQEEESAEKVSEQEMPKEQENDFSGETDTSDTVEQVEVIDNTTENAEATLDEAITPPFLTASLRRARAAVVPALPHCDRPISSNM